MFAIASEIYFAFRRDGLSLYCSTRERNRSLRTRPVSAESS